MEGLDSFCDMVTDDDTIKECWLEVIWFTIIGALALLAVYLFLK